MHRRTHLAERETYITERKKKKRIENITERKIKTHYVNTFNNNFPLQ